jgi:ubiquinone/menaquinone biosynthesis C-methylase UbiE
MSNQNLQRAYWDTNIDARNLGDSRWRARFNLEEEILFYQSPEQQHAYALMSPLEGKTVVELGGGLGINAIILARRGARVLVVDISLARLKFLVELSRREGLEHRIVPICSAAEQLGLQCETADYVYTKSVLIHTMLEKSVDEIRRVLVPGGKGIFVEPLKYHPMAQLYRALFGPKIWKQITTYFDGRRLAQVARPFARHSQKYFYLFAFAAFFWQYARRNVRTFYSVLRVLTSIDTVLLSVFPFLKWLCWFCVLEVTKESSSARSRTSASAVQMQAASQGREVTQ